MTTLYDDLNEAAKRIGEMGDMVFAAVLRLHQTRIRSEMERLEKQESDEQTPGNVRDMATAALNAVIHVNNGVIAE